MVELHAAVVQVHAVDQLVVLLVLLRPQTTVKQNLRETVTQRRNVPSKLLDVAVSMVPLVDALCHNGSMFYQERGDYATSKSTCLPTGMTDIVGV